MSRRGRQERRLARLDGVRTFGFDLCLRCRHWMMAVKRRRGGQPMPCYYCGARSTRRLSDEQWMQLLVR